MNIINFDNKGDKYSFSFQNPSYNDNFDIEKNSNRITQIQDNYIVNLSEDRIEENFNNRLNKNSSSNSNKSNSTFLQDVDVICCNKVFTVKPRTYNNIKNGIQMIMPFIVLLIMVIILISIFKIDVLIPSDDLNK